MRLDHGWRIVASILLLLAAPTAALESGPQGVVRQFCQADALGRRVTISGWANVEPLVTWSFEPAWDQVVLITGYAVESPRPGEGGGLAVDVRYDVVGQVSALGLDTAVHVETATFQVKAPDPSGWRILGPPPPPHLFANRVDIDQMRRSLAQGGMNFLPNTLFVWQMFRAAGWNVPFVRTADLLSGTAYRVVDQPRVGDVVVYLRDASPYHVGLLEAENQVVSSTLNAGILRTTIDAFPGEVKYLRLVEPEPLPTAAVTSPTPAPKPATVRHPTPHARTTPKPAHKLKKGKAHRNRTTRRPAQPSAAKRVKKRGKGKPVHRTAVRPAPVARGKLP